MQMHIEHANWETLKKFHFSRQSSSKRLVEAALTSNGRLAQLVSSVELILAW